MTSRADSTTHDLHRPVVVGFDGSPSSASALDAAAVEAVRLGVPLRIVHAYVWPIFYASLTNVPYEPSEWEPSASVRDDLSATAERLATRHPGLAVQSRVMAGTGGPVLVAESDDASMIVVGGRGIGGLAGLLAGSVAPYVASHARCPVMVVRAGHNPPAGAGRVVVGVDGSPSSVAALWFAGAWAEGRDATIDVIQAQPQPDPEASTRVMRLVEAARRRHPSLAVGLTVVAGPASGALLTASRSANLVVVGSRNRGEIASLMLGSVGHDLVRRSGSPVVVVHGTAPGSAAVGGDDLDDLVGRETGSVRRSGVVRVGDAQP
jgi:nucleotide-binding universal stress UspA family protein